MKNIILYSILIITLVGCDRKKIFRKYIIENNTTHKIRIQFFEYNRLRKSIEKTGQGVILEEIGNNGSGRSITAKKVLNADSVVIFYNENKRQIYCAYINQKPYYGIPDNKKNILNDSAYAAESNTLYRYTFTEEDYNNAKEF